MCGREDVSVSRKCALSIFYLEDDNGGTSVLKHVIKVTYNSI
jgi:hypothetical protein